MTFQDIFKSSFLETATDLTVIQIGITLAISFIIGLFIFQVYKRTYNSVVYTKSFNLSLVVMTMITSLVIMAVTSNIVLSLGMVGALSIVRFRTALKDPMDIVFMFWAIAVGIVNGAGLFLLAIVGSLVIGLIIYLFSVNNKKETPYILLITFATIKAEKLLIDKIKSSVDRYFIKSKTYDGDAIELTIEIRIKDDEIGLVNELKLIDSVSNIMLVSSNEYSS